MNEKNLSLIKRGGSVDKSYQISPEKYLIKQPNYDGRYAVNEKILEEKR